MSSPIILDLCGGSGAWSKPYRDAGYDVRLVTLPDLDVLTYAAPKDVHGILAAPPCEMFSLARQPLTSKGAIPRLEGFALGLPVVRRCLDIIWQCQLTSPLAWWALENPTGYLRRFLGCPSFTFEHWQYGERRIKPTDIWGHHKIPTPTHNQRPIPGTLYYRGQSPVSRARTPAGFARAFMLANP